MLINCWHPQAHKTKRLLKTEQVFDEHFKKLGVFFCLPMVKIVKHFGKLVEFMVDNEPRMLAIL